jgi:sarcosine oxidase, subunit gamma
MTDTHTALRRSPLAHRSTIKAMDNAARLSEVPFLGKLILRGDPGMVSEAVSGTVGASLPAACRASRKGDTAILWTGPNEFWIVTPDDAHAALADKLGKALSGIHHQVTDVSSYYTTIDLAGPKAREMLMKLTTLDMDRSAFTEGQVAGSNFGAAQATLWQTTSDGEEGGPVFRLFVRRSMADYLWCLLAEAGFEWGMPRQAPLSGETWRLAR